MKSLIFLLLMTSVALAESVTFKSAVVSLDLPSSSWKIEKQEEAKDSYTIRISFEAGDRAHGTVFIVPSPTFLSIERLKAEFTEGWSDFVSSNLKDGDYLQVGNIETRERKDIGMVYARFLNRRSGGPMKEKARIIGICAVRSSALVIFSLAGHSLDSKELPDLLTIVQSLRFSSNPPNQAPLPTTTSVTPAAAQPARQP